jgi:hypothetical protein
MVAVCLAATLWETWVLTNQSKNSVAVGPFSLPAVLALEIQVSRFPQYNVSATEVFALMISTVLTSPTV